jgi:hypothetical protein
MNERMYRIILGCAAVFLALWILFPFVRFAMYPGYQGLVPLRTGDDGAYYDRIQTALLGRYDEVDNGITGPGIHGAGSALVEWGTGFFLQDTGLHGPEAGVLLMVLIAPLFFIFFALFLRSLGVSAVLSLVLTVLYTALMLGSLQRPVNLSFTLPYTALTLLVFSYARLRKGIVLPLFAALLIGLLPGVYFWAWTFLWASLACVLFLQFFLPISDAKDQQTRRILWMGAGAFLIALPLLLKTWVMQVVSPYFADTASYRSGVYPSHWVESPIRSFLLLLLTIAAVTLFVRKKAQRSSLLIPVALTVGAFVVMHQNLIHGKDLMFSSHYYPFVCLAALVLSAWVLCFDMPVDWEKKRLLFSRWPSLLILLITALFLAAGFSDYRISWSLPFADPAHLDMQHLAPVLKSLTDGKRQTILTDAKSGLMVKAWTDDDVVFTPYVQSLLVSDADYIRRNCLSQALSSKGIDVRAIAWELTQFRGISQLPMREAQVRSLCAPFLQNLRTALSVYHVDLLLWDEKNHPDWVVDPQIFEKIQSGNGWSLWSIRSR